MYCRNMFGGHLRLIVAQILKNIPINQRDRDELVELVRDENIELNEIDTGVITDKSFLFARFSTEQCHDLFCRAFKHIESFVILAIEE
ncbi:hypothetical protein [Helicobacter rodentium]|uniref:hypothetical protein n=2 Tax=Helicobacter rodentium TaxID=59617 RepID=UPI00263A20CE|nr:hypothetical protein [Helicobacter rodentium]